MREVIDREVHASADQVFRADVREAGGLPLRVREEVGPLETLRVDPDVEADDLAGRGAHDGAVVGKAIPIAVGPDLSGVRR
jgi:hypothetical protein